VVTTTLVFAMALLSREAATRRGAKKRMAGGILLEQRAQGEDGKDGRSEIKNWEQSVTTTILYRQ